MSTKNGSHIRNEASKDAPYRMKLCYTSHLYATTSSASAVFGIIHTHAHGAFTDILFVMIIYQSASTLSNTGLRYPNIYYTYKNNRRNLNNSFTKFPIGKRKNHRDIMSWMLFSQVLVSVFFSLLNNFSAKYICRVQLQFCGRFMKWKKPTILEK